jgi:hypothetical protein
MKICMANQCGENTLYSTVVPEEISGGCCRKLPPEDLGGGNAGLLLADEER